jgi:hypothetical protein
MKGDIVVWYSGRKITDEQWDRIFKKHEEPKEEKPKDDDELDIPQEGQWAV